MVPHAETIGTLFVHICIYLQSIYIYIYIFIYYIHIHVCGVGSPDSYRVTPDSTEELVGDVRDQELGLLEAQRAVGGSRAAMVHHCLSFTAPHSPPFLTSRLIPSMF